MLRQPISKTDGKDKADPFYTRHFHIDCPSISFTTPRSFRRLQLSMWPKNREESGAGPKDSKLAINALSAQHYSRIAGSEMSPVTWSIMSRWRRIALGAVPSCKDEIETAGDVKQMWEKLGLEYIKAKLRQPPDVAKLKEILDFATEVQYLPATDYLRSEIRTFLRVKTAVEIMPSMLGFLLQHTYSEGLLTLLWHEFLGAYSDLLHGGGAPELRKMQEVLAFVRKGDYTDDPWFFIHRFAAMFSGNSSRHLSIFAKMIPPDTFQSWLEFGNLGEEDKVRMAEDFRKAKDPQVARKKRK